MPDTRRSLSALQTLFADNSAGAITPQVGRDELISSHPEKVSQSAAYAGEPPSGQLTGDLFLPTDGLSVERYSGSAWQPWGPLFPLTKPVDGDFSWLNQGSAAVTAAGGGLFLSAPANASANGVRARLKAAPATPYTITAYVLPVWDFSDAAYFFYGLCFTNGTTAAASDIHALQFEPNSAGSLTIVKSYKYDDASTGNSNYLATVYAPIFTPWLRIADDGTNRKLSVSQDGQNWVEIHSVGRTNFLTATHVGFFINPFSSDGGVTLLSWKEG